MKKICTIALPVLLLFPLNGMAQEEEKKQKLMEWKGYVKDIEGAGFINPFDSLSSINLLHNRLNARVNFKDHLFARIEVRNRIFTGNQLKQVPNFGELINQYNGILNLSHLWVNEPSVVIHSVADRLLVQYQTDGWDITIGRQRINWGVNTIWNPNDIFNAYNFLDFDYEERAGTDAIRLQHYYKNNTTLELAYKPAKNTNESIAAILYKFNKNKYDYQVLSGWYQSDIVVGAGWAGNIKEAGFKGELSYFHPRTNMFDTTGVISCSIMADKTFKHDWYASISVLFNSNPSGMLTGNESLLSSTLSAKQLFPFRYTFYTGVVKSFSPITSLNISVIYSPEKNTLIFYPAFSWNILKNIDADITAQSFFAEQNGFYKSLGNALFLRGKWSF